MNKLINVTLIRHGKTSGNLKHQYIGVTDQPLCSEGVEEILVISSQKIYKKAELVFSSPYKRCLETAAIIYKDRSPIISAGLCECNFGDFEGKSYDDLKDNANYQEWLDSNGTIAFPNGEASPDFIARCQKAFYEIIEQSTKNELSNISIICHGGTIMAILHGCSYPNLSFYNWQVKNGNGYSFSFDVEHKRATNITLLF